MSYDLFSSVGVVFVFSGSWLWKRMWCLSWRNLIVFSEMFGKIGLVVSVFVFIGLFVYFFD